MHIQLNSLKYNIVYFAKCNFAKLVTPAMDGYIGVLNFYIEPIE